MQQEIILFLSNEKTFMTLVEIVKKFAITFIQVRSTNFYALRSN